MEIPAFLTPVILLAGIYTGVMTPTEAAAIAGIYALLIAVFGYRMPGWKDLLNVLKDTVKGVGISALVIGSATCINYVIARGQIAVGMANMILGMTSKPYVFLLIVIISILILGLFIDKSLIQVFFISLLIPIAREQGIDMVRFGLVAIPIMMIGLSTPPFGRFCLLPAVYPLHR